MDYKTECGARVKRLRLGKSLTLAELSTKTGDLLSPTRISNYETGERLLSQQEAVILAKALGTRPAYLLAVDDIQIPISTQEEALIRNWRTLAEKDRMDVYRHVQTLALQARDPIADQAIRFPAIPAGERMPKAAVHKKVKKA